MACNEMRGCVLWLIFIQDIRNARVAAVGRRLRSVPTIERHLMERGL